MNKELTRKIFHLLLGLSIIILFLFDVINIYILLVLDMISIILYFLTIKDVNIPCYTNILKLCSRSKKDIGLISFLVGCTITLLFPKNIALASLCIFIFGDSTAFLIGRLGKTKTFLSKNKNIEGLFASFIISSILASLFVNTLFALTTSLIVMFIEHTNTKIDDNFFLAPLSGIILYVLTLFF